MKLIERKKFRKNIEKSDISIKRKVRKTLSIFFYNPFALQLNNHALKGSRKWQRSINVTGDRRIIFKKLSDGQYELVELIELIELWTHSQIYK